MEEEIGGVIIGKIKGEKLIVKKIIIPNQFPILIFSGASEMIHTHPK